MDERSALALFSGGQDSTTCLAWALDRFDRVETVGFDYRQRNRVELEARPKLRATIVAAFPHWGSRLGDTRNPRKARYCRLGCKKRSSPCTRDGMQKLASANAHRNRAKRT